jgi:signal transduction histidine kinase
LSIPIRTKIQLGFVVVLLAFGGATGYAAWAVRTLTGQLRLVALGYSTLRIELQDQQTLQANLQRRLAEPVQGPALLRALEADRKLRGLRLQSARGRLAELRRSLPASDAGFLDQVDARLGQVARLYEESEAILGQIYGTAGPAGSGGIGGHGTGTRPEGAELQRLQAALRAAEDGAAQVLQGLSGELTAKVIDVVGKGERYQTRAVGMTAFLVLLATGVGVVVLLLMQAALRPLRRLAEGAREVARGNYRQRVAEDSGDEVGALGREFNAMAAALEEREARLRRSEQLAAVGKMAAQITHEVRNPLSSIGLNAELLADEVAGAGSEAQTLARAIVKEVDRLTQVTEGYLRFVRLPEGRREPGDVSEMVRGLLRFQAGELAARGVTVEEELAAGLPPVLFDESQLRPALLNLVRNAAEAMAEVPAGRRVLRVRTARAGADPAAGVIIEVSDQGPGIPEAHRAHIFEPFFTTKQGGTGLGLALAHEVVVRHGGTLAVTCPREGGTRFTLSLPAGSGQGPGPAPAAALSS